MVIKSPVLTTTTSLTAMAHAFIGEAATELDEGVPIGINLRTREIEYFNPWAMKQAGILDSMFGLFLGKIKQGKSMAMKVIAARLLMLVAGFDNLRSEINDYKPEGKASEYGGLSDFAESETYRIADAQVNPLEPRMFMSEDGEIYEYGILAMAKAIIEFAKNSSLVGHEDTSLRIAVFTMLRYDSSVWGLGLLAKLLRSITDAQIKRYYRELDTTLKGQLEQRIINLAQLGDTKSPTNKMLQTTVEGQIRQLVAAKDNISPLDIQTSGEHVAAYLESILHGSFGKMLGDKTSLYDLSTQPVVTKDWRGVGSADETLMRIIDTIFKTAAVENHRLDLLPHLKIDDEQHKPMKNLVYATSQVYLSEIARGLHMCNLSASHRPNSLRRGSEGSELYNLGNTLLDNQGFFGVSAQNNDPKQLQELQQRLGCTNAERDNLPHLPKRVFALKYAEAEALRHVQIIATPIEIEFGKTEGAVERMMDRPDVNSRNDLVRFATQNGLKISDAQLTHIK